MSHTYKDVPRTAFLGCGSPVGPQLTDPGSTPGQLVPLDRDLVIFEDWAHTSVDVTVNNASLHYSVDGGGIDLVSATATDPTGGITSIAGTTDNHENYIASNANPLFPVSTKSIYFETRVELAAVTGEFFFGLAANNGSGELAIGNGLATLLATDHMGFKLDAVADLNFTMGQGSSSLLAVDTGHDMTYSGAGSTGTGVADTTLAFLYSADGTVTTWVNGLEKTSSTTNGATAWSTVFPNAAIGLYFGARNAATNAEFRVHYVYLHAQT